MIKRTIILLLMFLLIFSFNVFACVGARPLAMGGAFIAVADDANTTYWNPAGLTQLDAAEFTYTPTLYNRNEINYDDFVSFVKPLSFDLQDLGVFGLSFINSGYKTPYQIPGGTTENRIIDTWFWLSYGKKLLSEDEIYFDRFSFGDFSLGANLKYFRRENRWLWEPQSQEIVDDGDSTIGYDIACLWRKGKFSAGFLYQDINEPELEYLDALPLLISGDILYYLEVRTKVKYIRNFRPGFAFRPDETTTFALDIYDALGESTTADGDIRIGFEKYFDMPISYSNIADRFAIRFGGYDINSEVDSGRAITFGLGFEKSVVSGFLTDAVVDYAVMLWTDNASGTHEFTHFLGIGFKF